MLLLIASCILFGTALLIAAHLLLGHYERKLKKLENERVALIQQGLSQEFHFIEPQQLMKNLRWVLIAGFIFSVIFLSPWPVALSLTVTWFGPSAALKFIQMQRQKKFNRQLPIVLPAISSILKAGHTFERAIETLSRTQAAPMSQELELMLKELRLGATLDDALRNLSQRFPNRDLEIVVRAVEISRRVGSNLAEAFDRVAEMIRGRSALRDKLAGLTAQGRVQGWVAIAMPIGMTIVMSMMAPGYLSPLFNTNIGRLVLVGCAVMMTIGGVWIQKICNAELME